MILLTHCYFRCGGDGVPLRCRGVMVYQLENAMFLFLLIFSPDAKCQLLANLANFAYDPINYPHLKKLNVAELFLGKFRKLRLISFPPQSVEASINNS